MWARSAFVAAVALGCSVAPPGADAPHESTSSDPYGPTTPPVVDSGSDTPTLDTGTPSGDPAPMHGFSYVRTGLAGMPWPSGNDLDYLATEQIDLVVSLTPDPLVDDELSARGMALLHLPIGDFLPPTHEQQLTLVMEVSARQEAGDKVAVHCLAGLGRTGTMLATWLVAEGATAEAAIEEVRLLRPGSIETTAQEDAVRRFERFMEER